MYRPFKEPVQDVMTVKWHDADKLFHFVVGRKSPQLG